MRKNDARSRFEEVLEKRLDAANLRLANLYIALQGIWAFAHASKVVGGGAAHLEACEKTAGNAMANDEIAALETFNELGIAPRHNPHSLARKQPESK